MNSLTIIAVLSIVSLASAHPSWLAGPVALVGSGEPGALLKGPSSATTLLGPDGSLISTSAIGGTVVAAPKSSGIVTEAVAPIIVGAGPILTTSALSAPLWGVQALSTPTRGILAGPSGTVISPGLGTPLIAGPTKLIAAGLW